MAGKKVRVAIIGVGNCASALVQGVHYYRNAADDQFIPGLMHARLGGYHIGDVEFTAAFDIDITKVGKDLSEVNAYWSRQVFSGRMRPPPKVASPEEVLKWVVSHPGGIGFIELSKADARVRVVYELGR